MHSLELIPKRWLEYEPPSTCHDFGISALAAGVAAGVSSAASAVTAGAGAAALGAGTAGALAAVPLGVAGAASAFTGAAGAAATGLFGTGIGLAELGTAATVGGTLLSAKSGMDNAAYQSATARAEAAALKQKANEEAAAGQRVAITRRRQTDLVLSKARALAAASGTDATSADIVNTEGQIAAQGEYNALSALYEGQSRARTSNYQAEIDLFRSSRIDAGAPLALGGTLLSGLSSLAKDRQRNYLLDRFGT